MSVSKNRLLYFILIACILLSSCKQIIKKATTNTAKKAEIEVYEKISDAEGRLSSHDFLRIHKSYIVNLAHVQYIKSYTATLDNGIILPCSELKYKDIVAKYAVYKGRF